MYSKVDESYTMNFLDGSKELVDSDNKKKKSIKKDVIKEKIEAMIDKKIESILENRINKILQDYFEK